MDPNSYANIHAFATTHLELNWDLDFTGKRISGNAVLHLDVLDESADLLVLDTRGLLIQ